jgi:AbrB family looped-hinge helix DNA binding protein
MEEALLDSKGRIVIPEKLRKKLGLRKGSRVRMSAGPRSVVLMKSIDPKEFVEKMEGIIKKGSPAEAFDPLKLKEIWA